MKITIFLILGAVIVFLVFELLNRDKLKTLPKNAYLVDVRAPQEFSEENVAGTINIPLSQIEDKLTKFSDKENIVVFCRSGNRSEKAKDILASHGITNVINGGTWKDVKALLKE